MDIVNQSVAIKVVMDIKDIRKSVKSVVNIHSNFISNDKKFSTIPGYLALD